MKDREEYEEIKRDIKSRRDRVLAWVEVKRKNSNQGARSWDKRREKNANRSHVLTQKEGLIKRK